MCWTLVGQFDCRPNIELRIDIFQTKQGSTDMKSSVPRRGLQDIHTMSERVSDADNPQRKYLALAMLELEKARRNKEKQSANQRVANIDKRMVEIATAETDLLTAVEADQEASVPAERSGQPAAADSQWGGRGFKLAY
jgi:hypothetical protein